MRGKDEGGRMNDEFGDEIFCGGIPTSHSKLLKIKNMTVYTVWGRAD